MHSFHNKNIINILLTSFVIRYFIIFGSFVRLGCGLFFGPPGYFFRGVTTNFTRKASRTTYDFLIMSTVVCELVSCCPGKCHFLSVVLFDTLCSVQLEKTILFKILSACHQSFTIGLWQWMNGTFLWLLWHLYMLINGVNKKNNVFFKWSTGQL